jgi:hypothetical protein
VRIGDKVIFLSLRARRKRQQERQNEKDHNKFGLQPRQGKSPEMVWGYRLIENEIEFHFQLGYFTPLWLVCLCDVCHRVGQDIERSIRQAEVHNFEGN